MKQPEQSLRATWGVLTAATMVCLALTGGSAAETKSMPPQVQLIDQTVSQAWSDAKIRAASEATDAEFCRRVFLDVLGRIPSIEELDSYTSSRDRDKKHQLVTQLLYDSQYRPDYANHWATVWTNLLIGREDGGNDGRVSRTGMRAYLLECFRSNKPYDRMVHELISASGTSTPDSPDFNGAVNYLSGKLEDRATLATSHASRLFLGKQVQCTQCHNHPFNEWKQNQFWEMNSFFRQTVALRRFTGGTRDIAFVELTDQDFGGEDRPIDPDNARVYYELRNGRLEAAYPVFLDGQEIARSGFVEDVNRRARLADLIVTAPELSRTIVNRTWAYFLGHGFTRPIDDMGPHNLPQHPELLDGLATAFRENSHDLKQLMSWILLSEPYGLSCRPSGRDQVDDPLAGSPPMYSHFYPRQMTAEQLYESLRVARHVDRSQLDETARRRWLEQFTISFATDEGGDATTFDGTITQTLIMFNGDLIRQATSVEPGGLLYDVAYDAGLSFPDKVQRLYRATVSRPAQKREVRLAQQLLASYGGQQIDTLQDLWWALLNSNEFLLIH